ncbi:MAG TPA: ThuA domain-containing protein [Clostridia bacterium]|nr:ThuA domain-containing protein [Clostridia bacterium]
MKKALIFWGGWDGHEPELVSKRIADILEKEGFEVIVQDNQEYLKDIDKVRELDLIVPCWTGGELIKECSDNIAIAVGEGVGLSGCHGGMCDAFRNDTKWQFMTGGQWVSHPGGDSVEYKVNVRRGTSPIIEGIEDFDVCSEQYYLHVDPAVEVLATTRFPVVNYYHAANKPIDMPVVWTKYWGIGRVFYTSLGHHDDVFDKSPSAQEIMLRGMLWAANGKEFAKENGLTADKYLNDAKMY